MGGILLWRRDALGYVVAPGLLLQGGVLNAGYAIVLVVQSIFAGSHVNLPFVALAFVIGAISVALLVFSLRGAGRRQQAAPFRAQKVRQHNL